MNNHYGENMTGILLHKREKIQIACITILAVVVSVQHIMITGHSKKINALENLATVTKEKSISESNPNYAGTEIYLDNSNSEISESRQDDEKLQLERKLLADEFSAKMQELQMSIESRL